jgi:hypothetical protein
VIEHHVAAQEAQRALDELAGHPEPWRNEKPLTAAEMIQLGSPRVESVTDLRSAFEPGLPSNLVDVVAPPAQGKSDLVQLSAPKPDKPYEPVPITSDTAGEGDGHGAA